MDNYAAHQRVEIRDWLAHNPARAGALHADLSVVDEPGRVCFGIIERPAIRRGTFGSVRDLTTKIRGFIDGWNDRCHPLVWTKTANRS
jgi:hypothetical protein